jgi:hypothetical protein
MLVVDATEPTVKAGRTNPEALLQLINNRGVRVFTAPNLHAKVIVAGRRAFVGSTNASALSADTLIEAVASTTDPAAVASARQFVRDNCLQQLTPKMTKKLCAIYEPPRVSGGRRGRRGKKKSTQHGPPLRLAQLELQDWSEADQEAHDAAQAIALKKRKHPKTYELESFRMPGTCRYARDDVVIQVLDEGKKCVYVSPPGNVLHTATRKTKRGQVSFVYLERPGYQNRRQVAALARRLGKGALKKLRRDGLVRNRNFANSLLQAWHTS